MAIETDKFGLTDDQKMRLTSVGLTKEEIKMVNDTRISKEIADARAQLDKLESKIGGKTAAASAQASATKPASSASSFKPFAPTTDIEKKVCSIVTGVHPAIISYILSDDDWSLQSGDDAKLVEANSKLEKVGKDTINANLADIFKDFEDGEIDFSSTAKDKYLAEAENAVSKDTPEGDQEAEHCSNIVDTTQYARDVIRNIIG